MKGDSRGAKRPAGGRSHRTVEFLPLLTGAIIALVIAYLLKSFYSQASATQLLWILAPSAWLARFLGGVDLVYEQGAGFISHTYHLVVGPACAGVNFLIICFLCLYFSFARHLSGKTRWLAIALLISYAATIAANGLRIFVAAHLWTADIYNTSISREEMHRLAGTVIYYTSLLALYFVVGSCIGVRGRRIAPLFWYLSISLGVPLAGRLLTAGTTGFEAHAAWVMSVAVLLTLVMVLPSIVRNRIHLKP
jgi:exosortase K